MSIKKNVCYWCGELASTREHVPARCFFPSETLDGKKWDRLITVRACEKHNNAKGQFDEYLRNYVVLAAKGIRAQENWNAALKSILRNDLKEISIVDDEVKFGIYDENIGFGIEAIARALYFHEYDKCFAGRCSIYYGSYALECRIAQRNKEILDYYIKEYNEWSSSICGNHPDVFTYRFGQTDKDGFIPLLICFYETVYALAILQEKEQEPLWSNAQLHEAIAKVLEIGIDPLKLMFTTQGYNHLKEKEKGQFRKER